MPILENMVRYAKMMTNEDAMDHVEDARRMRRCSLSKMMVYHEDESHWRDSSRWMKIGWYMPPIGWMDALYGPL